MLLLLLVVSFCPDCRSMRQSSAPSVDLWLHQPDPVHSRKSHPARCTSRLTNLSIELGGSFGRSPCLIPEKAHAPTRNLSVHPSRKAQLRKANTGVRNLMPSECTWIIPEARSYSSASCFLSENGREEEKGKRASAEVRSFAKKKKTLLLRHVRESENFRKRNETRDGFENKTSFFDGTAADR